MIRHTAVIALTLAAACLAGCHSGSNTIDFGADKTSGENADRNDGYSLLYNEMKQLKDVGKALMLREKTEPFDTTIRAIGAMANAAYNQIDAFSKEDPGLRIDLMPLPTVETEVRKSIQISEAEGLFTSKGANFQRRLLLSQQNGLEYAEHLAKVIRKYDDNRKRKEFLESLEKQAHGLREEVIKLIAETPAK